MSILQSILRGFAFFSLCGFMSSTAFAEPPPLTFSLRDNRVKTFMEFWAKEDNSINNPEYTWIKSLRADPAAKEKTEKFLKKFVADGLEHIKDKGIDLSFDLSVPIVARAKILWQLAVKMEKEKWKPDLGSTKVTIYPGASMIESLKKDFDDPISQFKIPEEIELTSTDRTGKRFRFEGGDYEINHRAKTISIKSQEGLQISKSFDKVTDSLRDVDRSTVKQVAVNVRPLSLRASDLKHFEALHLRDTPQATIVTFGNNFKEIPDTSYFGSANALIEFSNKVKELKKPKKSSAVPFDFDPVQKLIVPTYCPPVFI